VHQIFISDLAFQHNNNIQLCIYTRDKLRLIQIGNRRLDWALPIAHTQCTAMLLYRKVIAIFNILIPSQNRIKPHDITLKQRFYDEDEELHIPDEMWGEYQFNFNYQNNRPKTRKDVTDCIFKLSRSSYVINLGHVGVGPE